MSPPSPNYPAAARRHKRDGDALHGSPSGRLESADHLYGFAAECALLGSLCVLHQAGVYPNLVLSPEGTVEDRDLRCKGHIKELWDQLRGRIYRGDPSIQRLFQSFSGYRDGNRQNPFRDWSVSDRYRGDGFAVQERVLVHQKAAELCIGILKQVEQSYLKRSAAEKKGS